MFEELFEGPIARARQRESPLPDERRRFLSHLQTQQHRLLERQRDYPEGPAEATNHRACWTTDLRENGGMRSTAGLGAPR